jgi:uncharacterized protein
MLIEGRGVVCDLKTARAWFKRAADSGMSDFQVALAEMMLNGRGGPACAAAALDLFEKAAAKGHAGAMFALGVLHADAMACPQTGKSLNGDSGLCRYLTSGVAGDPDDQEARLRLERAVA